MALPLTTVMPAIFFFYCRKSKVVLLISPGSLKAGYINKPHLKINCFIKC